MTVTKLPRFRAAPGFDARGRSVWHVWDAVGKVKYQTKAGTLGAALAMAERMNGKLVADVPGGREA